MSEAIAYWITSPGAATLRREPIAEPGRDEVLVRTAFTAISRGTESLVFRGQVPRSEHDRMRAPFQQGDFPGPVKYGYLNVGVVEHGSADILGRSVFTLFPHQSAFVVPRAAVTPLPSDVPARRGVLAGAVETAVNVLWDAAPLVGDRITVVGAGVIGCAVARLAGDIPGAEVTVVDVDRRKERICRALGVAYVYPDDAPLDQDVVIDASGTETGLLASLRCAAVEGEVIVASWFGSQPVSLPLGEAFHARRLTIRSSQVGMVAPRRRGSRTTGDRLALAVELLRDPTFDALLTDSSSWRDLPSVMAGIANGERAGVCHTIDWRDAR